MTARVRCHSDAAYPGRPLSFEWQGAWLAVSEVLRQERTPSGLTYRVLAEDGERYRLSWDEATDRWSIAPAKKSEEQI